MVNIISIKNYFIMNEKVKSKLIEDIFYSKRIHDNKIDSYKCGANFKLLRDRSNTSKKLYKKFLKASSKIFGNISLTSENKSDCHALCTNKNYWESVPHNHIQTSSINAVYYLNIPKINNNYCGAIMFFDGVQWIKYQPEPYEMIIMPNYLYHDTEYHNTEEWRISLNFEIKCKNLIDWSKVNNKP